MAKPDEEEDLGFYLALVLNFPLGLGAMYKSKKRKTKTKTKGRLHKKDQRQDNMQI